MLFISPTDTLSAQSAELVYPLKARVQGNFLHVLDLGAFAPRRLNTIGASSAPGRIHTYDINPSSGSLTYRSTLALDSPNSRYFLPSELAFFTTASGQAIAYAGDSFHNFPTDIGKPAQQLQILNFDGTTGQFSLAPSTPSTFTATTNPVGLRVQGNFLYVLDGVPGVQPGGGPFPSDVSHNLDIYRIDAATGALSYQSSLDLAGGNSPFLARFSDLRFYSTESGQVQLDILGSGNPLTFRVDPLTGGLTQTGIETVPYRTRLSGDRRVVGDFLYSEDFSLGEILELPINDQTINSTTAQPNPGSGSSVRRIREPQLGLTRFGDSQFASFTTQTGAIKVYYPDTDNQRIVVLDETVRPEGVGTPGLRYSPQSTIFQADLAADGLPDLVWRNYQTGETMVWGMAGTQYFGTVTLPAQPDLNWQLASVTEGLVRDSNRYSYQANLVWHNASTGETQVWRFPRSFRPDSTSFPPSASPQSIVNLPTVDPSWQLMATGVDNNIRSNSMDYSPAYASMVWRNSLDGRNQVWNLGSGAQVVGVYDLPTVADLNWTIAAMGDLDYDGQKDLVWRNTQTGQNLIWLMQNSHTVKDWLEITSLPDQNWVLEQAYDANLDGRMDLLWRNYATGENIAWLMHRTTPIYALALPSLNLTDWELQSPRPRVSPPVAPPVAAPPADPAPPAPPAVDTNTPPREGDRRVRRLETPPPQNRRLQDEAPPPVNSRRRSGSN